MVRQTGHGKGNENGGRLSVWPRRCLLKSGLEARLAEGVFEAAAKQRGGAWARTFNRASMGQKPSGGGSGSRTAKKASFKEGGRLDKAG